MLPVPELLLLLLLSGEAGEDVLPLLLSVEVDGVLLEEEGLLVSLVTPSAVVTVEPEEEEDPGGVVLPVSKESVPTMPPLLPVPASFSKSAGFKTLFLLIRPSQAFQ